MRSALRFLLPSAVGVFFFLTPIRVGDAWTDRVAALLQAVDAGDVGMVQRREDSGFTVKPGQAFRIIGEDVREDFEGHVPAELRVPGAIHLTHAA